MNTNKPITALAFDFGTRSIGVAFGQSLTGSARELQPLAAKDGTPDWEAVQKLIREWQPQRLLVGLPLNMDGSESEFGNRARKFGQRLHGRTGLPVDYVDERLSTRAAKQEAFERGHKGNYARDPVDSIAARIILEDWLRARS
ncbi:Holliday junction resolvase RuvX [Microbulbifer thermotolerans]|uniref:Putative pre-16S rRNA nuclease n=1 Tax=Microbulbifer thermotolerans TaxID=252514 RepID=A0A143HHZ9_MICTH|nr:Holliday junction resolvase RuvX [Microbulbifer thermotolerans]AMX01345.1 crossover junction endodeoxyribonuclease RuvA [Microbulbifer thermotolerans]MCX2780285.1 Holliday junction resolvase RuvX [Microbulbifer thermotolerans]MCX2782748.1 Holliday junction resolvase RuvX [Microbulbifer thermotolerans]MCX2795503.1 Holliday junction resolvase RuvX [Microbulbifer thermotolerans]MCX2800216.1 Holliday junction resolvase RuvX [Microbulbifer thermotolerans]